MPGGAVEAEADYERLAQVKLLVPSAFRGSVPARDPALRYGITLNDRGYFWEDHAESNRLVADKISHDAKLSRRRCRHQDGCPAWERAARELKTD